MELRQMIADIRTFIKSIIKSVDSRYIGNDKPFEDEGAVISTKADFTYHLDIGASTLEIGDDLGSVANVSCTLKIFRQGGSDKLSNYDQGYCDALLINSLILDRSRLNGQDYIKGITTSSVNPVEVEGSQDLYSFESTLIFKLSYGIGD